MVLVCQCIIHTEQRGTITTITVTVIVVVVVVVVVVGGGAPPLTNYVCLYVHF